ncbi:MAG: LysR family transcriptional regulator [Rhizobiales bacterium]|nr:LysR family transcriptional regulator [Hyphomicrobiales bacterium]
MNLRQLRSLVAIGDHGSFAAAGKVIGLSPSALSLQVKSLEEELGEQLFDQPPSYRSIGLVHRQQNANELLVATFYDALGGLANRLAET